MLALQEIQDKNGAINDGTTDATQTMQLLVDAIVAAGGPEYEFFDVALGVSDPDAFAGTRNPLVATFKGKEITVINNHLTSRFDSRPVFGGPQPFVQAGEAAREAQTSTLNEAVDALLDAGRGNRTQASKARRVIVLGDLNTMEFTDDITELLPGTGPDRVLTNLIDRQRGGVTPPGGSWTRGSSAAAEARASVDGSRQTAREGQPNVAPPEPRT